jgi:hypothetical protein
MKSFQWIRILVVLICSIVLILHLIQRIHGYRLNKAAMIAGNSFFPFLFISFHRN